MLIKYCIKLRLIKKGSMISILSAPSPACKHILYIFYKFRGCVNILYASFTNFEDIKNIYIQEKISICNRCNKGRHGLYEGILIWKNGGAGFSILILPFFFFNRRNKVLFFYKKVILFKRERERERER